LHLGKDEDIILPDTMTKEMDDALDGGLKNKDPEKQYTALHDAIATALALAFLMWLPSQQVMLVLGKGPIPTFAPPFVPVGPVMAGDKHRHARPFDDVSPPRMRSWRCGWR